MLLPCKLMGDICSSHRMRRYHAMSVSRGRVAAKAYSIAWSLSPILRLMPQRDANEINTIGKLTLKRASNQRCAIFSNRLENRVISGDRLVSESFFRVLGISGSSRYRSGGF